MHQSKGQSGLSNLLNANNSTLSPGSENYP